MPDIHEPAHITNATNDDKEDAENKEPGQVDLKIILEEYFHLIQETNKLEMFGEHMCNEITRMIQNYQQKLLENSLPDSLLETRQTIERAVILLTEFWDLLSIIQSSINQTLSDVF